MKTDRPATDKPRQETASNVTSESEYVRDYGDRLPEFYAPILAELVKRGKPGTTLDLGAGLGLLVECCDSWGLDIVGLEGSHYAVEEAVKRSPGLRIFQHDLGGAPLPFSDGSISNIILNQVVEHIDPNRLAKLLEESHRVLAAGGVIFVYSPSRRNRIEKTEPTHINLLLPSELRSLLEKAGFQVMAEPNYGFWFLPTGPRLINFLAYLLLQVLPHDWLSSTANAISRRR